MQNHGDKNNIKKKKTRSEGILTSRSGQHFWQNRFYESVSKSGKPQCSTSISKKNIFKKLIPEMNEPVKENEKLLKSNKIAEVNKYKWKLEDYRTGPENVDFKVPFQV